MDQYYYKKLSLQHQILYRKMHDAIKRQNEFILCGENECSEKEYYRVLDAILLDNPNVFYIMPCGLSFEQTMWGLIKVKLEYIVDKSKRETLKEDLVKQVNQLYEKVDFPDSSKEEKAEKIHDILMSEVELTNLSGETHPYEKTIIGPLVCKKAIDAGIAFCYKALLDRMEIENIVVRGFVYVDNQERQMRMWNVIKYRGEERHIDIAEDIMRYKGGESAEINFARLPEEIGINHFWEGKQTDNENKRTDEWFGIDSNVEVDSGSWEILSRDELKGMDKTLDENQVKLICILAKYPLECNDSRRLKAILCDVLPADKALINVFVSAYEEHIYEKLNRDESIELIKNAMTLTLENKYGYNTKLCDWAIKMWMILSDIRKKL